MTPRTEDARERLLAATATALEKRELDEVSINDVVAAAGAGVGTVYRHFSGKADLVGHAFARFVFEPARDEAAAVDDADPRGAIRTYVHALLRHAQQYRGLTTAMLEVVQRATIRHPVDLPDDDPRRLAPVPGPVIAPLATLLGGGELDVHAARFAAPDLAGGITNFVLISVLTRGAWFSEADLVEYVETLILAPLIGRADG